MVLLSCIPGFDRGLCSNEMHTGLYLVRATALKQRLETAADSTANRLLDQIQSMARDSNDHVCETYTQMASGVSVVGYCWPTCFKLHVLWHVVRFVSRTPQAH